MFFSCVQQQATAREKEAAGQVKARREARKKQSAVTQRVAAERAAAEKAASQKAANRRSQDVRTETTQAAAKSAAVEAEPKLAAAAKKAVGSTVAWSVLLGVAILVALLAYLAPSSVSAGALVPFSLSALARPLSRISCVSLVPTQ